jgi:hypothetical protein
MAVLIAIGGKHLIYEVTGWKYLLSELNRLQRPCRVCAPAAVLINAVQHPCGRLNSAAISLVFGSWRHSQTAKLQDGGFLNPLKMTIGRILLLWALAAAAQAQQPQGRPFIGDPDLLLRELSYTMRLELESLPAPSRAGSSSVFTSDYWSRAYDERAQLETRFGIHLAERFRPYVVQQVPVPGHPHFNFVQELRWPGGQPLTGLQFERKNLLLQGDRLSIRATSDLQTLFRGVGLSGSETEVELLSLLGWRSHSRLVWQLGEPTRELQWQVSAGMDRRAYSQSSSVDVQLLRRF